MAVLSTSGRTAIAVALAERTLHLAWGTGNASWDTTPVVEDIDATTLTAEIGRAAVAAAGYAIPLEEGETPTGDDIETPTGWWRLSQTPTNNLYLRIDFGYGTGAGSTIREVGLFADTTVIGGLPPGQVYFEPDEVTDQGILVALEHFPALVLTDFVRQVFEFVLVI